MRQKVTDILLCILLGLLPLSTLLSEEIRILESNDMHIIFEYVPDDLILQVTSEGVYVKAKHCEYTEDIGKPLLPLRTLHIGIPENSNYSIDLLNVETETKLSVDVLPVPEVFTSEGVSEYRFAKDEELYSTNEYYPSEQLFTKLPSFLRDQRILPVKVLLSRYNPLQQSLIILKKIRIRVSFTPPGVKKFWKDDKFERVYKTLLLNYEQSKFWRRSRKPKKQPDDPFLQSNFWYKLSITEEGLYKIGYTDLHNLGVNPGSIDPRTLKLYNGGSKPLPENRGEPRPPFREIAVWVEGEKDGSFDPGDYLLFYGVSTSRWEYDETDEYSYFGNAYTDTNVFWLTWGGEEGLRMEIEDGALQNPNPIRPFHFWTALRIEENRSNPAKGASQWVDDVISRMAEKSYNFASYGVETTDLAFIYGKLRLGKPRKTYVTHKFEIYLNDALLDKDSMSTQYLEPYRWVEVDTLTDDLLDGNNEITVKNMGGPNSTLNVDFFEIRYDRKYIAKDNQLLFTLPRLFSPGTYEFEISEFTSTKPFLLDVTDPLNPKITMNFEGREDSVRFQASINTRRFYYLTCWERLKSVSRIEVADFQHLRSSEGADYIALVHDDLQYAVQPLIAWRRHQQEIENPVVVKISSVYDEFSWGLKDPTAIRDFLKYWYENASYKPSYCLLVGDGSYDYKNYLRLEKPDNLIPPTSSCMDDWYGMLDAADSYRDVCIGRISPHSPQEAQSIISRIVNYEQAPNYGFWRNRILLLADNLKPGELGGDFPGDIEDLSMNNIPNHFDIRKIHLLYKTYNDPHEWPTATEDAIKEWSEGFLVGCFMGHGGPHTVAHEQLLLYKDIFSFKNGMRLPFFYFASCDIGRFDVPNDPCLGENLLKVEDGGAIAVLAASRPTTHPTNASIAFGLFDEIFFTTPTPTLGEALLVAKPSRSVHTLFGDPATRISSAARSVKVSAIPDSLASRSQVSVIDSLPQGFRGYANIYVFDSAELYYIDSLDLYLYIPGVPIFKGTIQCEGVDTLSFIVPMRLHQEGELGRISCYAWNDTLELIGGLDSLKVGGLDSLISDTTGPSITLFEGDRVLEDGDFAPPIFQLMGTLEDSSGIYIVPRPSPWFLLEINGYPEADLSRYFMYDVGSSMKGRFDYTLKLNEGENKIKVVARDNLLNRTSKEVELQVSSPAELTIRYAFNYPNPISDWTYFTFYLTQKAICEIKIFTISGTLVKSIKNIQAEVGQNQVYWDGKDSDGDSMANGVYVYKIIARSYTDSSEWGSVKAEASLIEKLVVMR